MTSNARGSGRILGSLRSADGRGVVRMEDRFDTEIDGVWSALTDPSRLARWYGQDGKAAGAWKPVSLRGGLLLRIKDGDEPDEHDIEAMLSADGDQTILVWEERGLPLDLLSAYAAGVQLHVEDLSDHLAGRERRDDAKARWDELHPAYQDLAAIRS
jgi:hypothetical protein